MRILLTADWHLRGIDIDAATRQLARMMEIADADYAIHSGDVFDKENVHDKHGATGPIMDVAASIFAESPFPWLIIDGNHDKPADSKKSALAPLSKIQGVRHVSVPERVDVSDTVTVYALPWFYEPEALSRLQEIPVEEDIDRFTILAGHLQVQGTWMSKDEKCKTGSFSIAKNVLSGWCQKKGVDYIALGDFHMRQPVADSIPGGYIGAIRQLRRSEMGNPAGFEILDTETGECAWHELDEAPQYTVVKWEKGEPMPDVGDEGYRIVRPDGWTPDPAEVKNLESRGVEVDPIVSAKEKRRRIDEMPDEIAGDWHKILDIWLREEGASGEGLHDILDEILSIGALPGAMERHEGSSQITPIASQLIEIGPHENATIRWEDQGEFLALLGGNGAGKSFLFEADHAALFGRFASRPGSLYEYMTTGGSRESVVRSWLRIGDTKYKIERILTVSESGKTRNQDAFVYRSVDDEWEKVAGPLTDQVATWVAANIGDEEDSLGAWHYVQADKGRICSMRPGERRAFYGRLLGHEALQEISDRGKKIKTELLSAAKTIRDRAGDRDELAEKISNIEKSHATEKESLQKAEADLESIKEKLSKARQKKEAAAKSLERARSAAKSKERRGKLVESLKDARESVAEAKKAKESLPILKDKIAGAEDLRARIRAHEKAAKARGDYEQAHARIVDLLTDLPEASPTDVKKSFLVDALTREVADLKESRDLMRRKYQDADKRVTRLEAELEGAPPTEPTRHADVCDACVLYKNATEQFAETSEKKRLLREADSQRAEALKTGKELSANLEEKQSELADAKAAKARVDDISERRHKIAKRICDCKRDRDRIEYDSSDIEEGIEDLRERYAEIKAVQAKLEAASKYADDLERRERKLDNLEKMISDIDEEIESAPDTGDAQEAFGASIETVKTFSEKADMAGDRFSAIRSQLAVLTEKKKAATEALDTHDKNMKDAASSEKKAKAAEVIRRAFDKRGAQALLLDAAVAELEEIANEAIAEITDSKFAIEIRTQVENRDGSYREDFAVLARDSKGVRDVYTYSGGEKKLFDLVFTYANNPWTRRKTGRGMRSLRIDEAFDSLDQDRALALIDFLHSNRGDFDQIVCVTHNTMFASRIPHHLDVENYV